MGLLPRIRELRAYVVSEGGHTPARTIHAEADLPWIPSTWGGALPLACPMAVHERWAPSATVSRSDSEGPFGQVVVEVVAEDGTYGCGVTSGGELRLEPPRQLRFCPKLCEKFVKRKRKEKEQKNIAHFTAVQLYRSFYFGLTLRSWLLFCGAMAAMVHAWLIMLGSERRVRNARVSYSVLTLLPY